MRQKRTSEYQAWLNMLGRCYDKNDKDYSKYGGRGIKVCVQWHDFINFFVDVGPKPSKNHSLDRFPDQNGDYEPENCRWATFSEQARNRKSNHLITIKGQTKTLIEWCEIYKIPYKRVKSRINTSGWEPLRALTAPIKEEHLDFFMGLLNKGCTK